MTTSSRFGRLHLLTLSGFAVAQPLYDLIGNHTEFLVAYRASPTTIAAFIAALSAGIGGAIVLAVEMIRRSLGPRAGRASHALAITVLGALIAAGMARTWTAAVAIPLSLAAGIALAVVYDRHTVRTFLTLLTPAIVIFPILFLIRTPVSRLAFPSDTAAISGDIRERPTIVVVVFDELSTFDFLDASGSIDGAAFPALAELAKTSTWFPNALSPFPYTERAIPAILTGVQADAADARLPIAGDHPRNLFTWLGDSYGLHASEPITQLCPRRLCGIELTSGARTGAMDLARDTATLYLHLVAPRDLAERHLPSLEGRWQGFAATAPAAADVEPRPESFDIVAAFGRAAQPGRDTLFRQFLDGIDEGRKPALHFIHVLLPHDPYVFTPSGRRYSPGGLTEGMGPDGVWTTEQPLVDTGHQRHLAQARLSDRLLGELLTRLRSKALLDDALVIVTADHGAAFKPGESHRGMSASNAAEIVAVPLFVKLPRQRDAAINERHVSGVDIAPTIAAALATPLPWRHDGHDVLDPQYPVRSTLEYRNSGVEPLALFDVRAAARTGEYGPAALIRTSPAPKLLDMAIADVGALPVAQGIRVFSESFARLQNVSDAGLVPALVSGEVHFDAAHPDPVALALAVNGRIAAVTRTVRWAGSDHYFNVLLPDPSITIGVNRLDVLLVQGRADQTQTVARIADDFTRDMVLADTPSGPVVATATGTRMPAHASVSGFIDRASRAQDGGDLTLSGWAADTGVALPLRAIVAFAKDRAVAVTAPHAERPDVTAALQLRPARKVSFALTIPRQFAGGAIRVLGVSSRGVIGELQSAPAAAAVLRGPNEQ